MTGEIGSPSTVIANRCLFACEHICKFVPALLFDNNTVCCMQTLEFVITFEICRASEALMVSLASFIEILRVTLFPLHDLIVG